MSAAWAGGTVIVLLLLAPVGSAGASPKLWAEQTFGAGNIQQVHVHSLALEHLGKSVHTVKALDAASGAPVSICFDEDGAQLSDCGEALRKQETAAKLALYGTLDPELWLALRGLDDVSPVPVEIWLRSYEPSPVKEDVLKSPEAMAGLAAEHQTAQEPSRKALAQVWPYLTTSPLRIEPEAPVAYAELNAVELAQLQKQSSVARVYLHKESQPDSAVWVQASEANGTGYDGTGVTVCVIELDQPIAPNTLTVAGTYCGAGDQDEHTNIVMGMIRSGTAPYGIAPDASTRAHSWHGCDNNKPYPAISQCAQTSARVWNWSNASTTLEDRLFDYWAKRSPYPLITQSSGNFSSELKACGVACDATRVVVNSKMYNGLLVGGSNDCGTSTRSDDGLYCKTRDLNPTDSRELPHLVAPAQCVDVEGFTCEEGTSFAAPQVAGAAAQLQERNSALRYWPEATRSILMTGATENIHGGPLSLSDTVDDRDGAGALSVQHSLTIGQPGAKQDGGNTAISYGHDYGTITAVGTPASSFYGEEYNARTSLANMRLRVVLSWDASTTCTDPSLETASCAAQTLDADLDLYVYAASGGIPVASMSVPNTYEFLEFDAVPNETYIIKIRVYSWTQSSTWFGLSWYFWPYTTT